MVHVRLNERESNPNKYINFISVLPAATQAPHSEGDARELLRALAAQVRPVMKDHGFAVNRLEEVRTATTRFRGRGVELSAVRI